MTSHPSMRPLLVATLAAVFAVGCRDAQSAITRPLSPTSEPSRDFLAGACPAEFNLQPSYNSSIDRNGDGFQCERTVVLQSGKKTFLIDNNVSARGMCPVDFPTLVNTGHAMGLDAVDQNTNNSVCMDEAGDSFTDDNR
jgi:hypothetical protein